MLVEEPVPVRLMATIWANPDGLHDDLDTPAQLDAWLEAVGVDRSGGVVDFRSARDLRDAVRRLAAFVTGDERAATRVQRAEAEQAARTVNTAAKLPPDRLTVTDDGLALLPAAPAAPLAVLAAECRRFLAERAGELRACYAPGCVLFFTKTHPRREWCSVTCGNRVRAARHYQAHRGHPGEASTIASADSRSTSEE